MPEVSDTTRLVRKSSGPLPYTVGDTNFRGMDSRVEPERLEPGIAPLIENYLSTGDGSLRSRKGFQGVLTSAYANPIYALTRFVTSAGTAYFVWATGGKLYYSAKDATSGTEIKKPGAVSFSFTNNGRGVMIRRHGKFLYLIDSEDSSAALIRIDLAAVIAGAGSTYAEVVSGLTAPTGAPTAAKYDNAVINAVDATGWTLDTLTGMNANLAPASAAGFIGGDSTGSNVGPYWKTYHTPKTYTQADVSDLPVLDSSKRWFRVDDPQDRILLCTDSGASTTLYVSNAYATNSLWTENVTYKRYATRYDITFDIVALGASKPMWVKLQWFSAAPGTSDMQDAPLLEQNYSFTPTTSYKTSRVTQRVDITGLITQGDPVYMRVFVSADASSTVGTVGPYITNFNIVPLYPELKKIGAGETDFSLYAANGLRSGVLSGFWAVFAPGSALDLTKYAEVQLNMSQKGVWSTQPSFRLRFRNSSYQTWSSAQYTLAENVLIDITAMPSAIRSSISHIAFEFTSDATIVSTLGGRTTPTVDNAQFIITSLTQPGNLSALVSYTYLYSHFDRVGSGTYTDGGIESLGSPFSPTIDMGQSATRVKVVIPAYSVPSGVDYFPIWRLGGATPDGDSRARLAAFVPVASNAALPSGTTVDDPTNKWYWDYASRTFYDNVPDSDLYNADIYQVNRDLPPSGATSIAIHGDRVVLGKNDRVYLSWLIGDNEDAGRGMYFSYSSDPADPDVDIKGALLRVAGVSDSNKVVALQPLILDRANLIGTALAVMMSDTPPSIITGWTGDITKDSAFQVRPFPQEIGGGCLAPKSVVEAFGGLLYGAASGIVQATNTSLIRKSLPLETELSLFGTSQARYSQMSALLHDSRVMIMINGSGSTDGTIYVLDQRIEADKGWFKLTPPVGMTCGVSLSGNLDSGDLYFGGRDGQIYKYTGTADKATPSGSLVAITATIESRRHGQSSAQGSGLYGVGRPYQVEMEANVGADTAFTVTLKNEYAISTAKTYNVPSGREKKTVIRGFSDVRGKLVSIRVAASSTSAITLRGYLIYLTEGGSLR